MRCKVCGRIAADYELEEGGGICFECSDPDDFDADELGLDPEEEFDA
jgi:hypothetical protein